VNASPVLENVWIENNRATSNVKSGGGGGIYNLAVNGGSSSPRLKNTVIYSNSVMGNGVGGGMYNISETAGSTASPELDGVTIEMNQTSGRGGGLSVHAEVNGAVCEPHIKGDSRIIRNAAAYGGGVSISGFSAPQFNDVEIRGNNSGGNGGGVAAMDADETRPVFINTAITGNSSYGGSGGGGVYNTSPYLVISNATISHNTAPAGGGIRNINGGGAILTNVLFDGNTAFKDNGGAIGHTPENNNARNVLIITNGIIRNNKAAYGGGIYSGYSYTGSADSNLINYLVLTNVLIAENEATAAGGGIRAKNDVAGGKGVKIVMNNVTIANNRPLTGSGMSLTTTNTGELTVTANNSIIWGNSVAYNEGTTDIIVNYDVNQLTLKNSLAWSKNAASSLYTDAGGNKTASSFTGANGPFADADTYTIVNGSGDNSKLINGGNDALYPNTAADLLPSDVVLAETGTRDSDFRQLISRYVINTGHINKNAAAAESTWNTPPSGGGNSRKNGGIDVGAYEE
jgi:hypothetical protein